ncbi:MAG: hypothetical protein Q7S39_03950 [Ignavibacteria bacterium]|nr:hypothetical protein [Ignavibacteria bacterium]
MKPQIINSVNRDGKIDLQIEFLDYSLFQNALTSYKTILTLTDSTGLAKDSTSIIIPYSTINGINWITLLFGSGYTFGNLIIDNPEIRIKNFIYPENQMQKNNSPGNTVKSSSIAQQITNILPDELNPLKISKIVINSANLIKIIQDENKTVDSVKNISISISDLNLNKDFNYKDDENSIIGNYEIRIKEFHQKMSGPGYDLKISSITASGNSSELKIKELIFQPYISDEEFFKGDKYRRDRWIAKIPEITVHQTDLIKFLNENIISISSLNIPNFRIEIFTNRRLPIDPASNPEMPHEIMSSLSFGIEIGKFQTDNSLIILESVMPNVERRAHLEFTNVNALIHNISNTQRKQTKDNPYIITASGNLQGEGKINIKLNYPLLSEQLNFNYKGSLGEMDAKLFNSHLEVEDKTHIESGKIVQATFSSEVRNGIAFVNIIPIYNNLKLKILDEESTEMRGLATLLINAKIRESNPDEEGKIKSANINYKRKPSDTFLDVILLALLKGLGEVGF